MHQCPYCLRREGQVKAGLNAGNQRYKCIFCRRRYTPQQVCRGYPGETRQEALALVAQGVPLRRIGRQMDIAHTTILNWVRGSNEPSGAAETVGTHQAGAGTKRRASVTDVAQRAGVSTSTVSNYVNEKGRMSEATRARIDRAMAELHYAPSGLMRAIRQGRTYILGVLTFGLIWTVERGADSITAPLLQGIATVADATSHELLLYTGWPYRTERYSERNFLSGHVDGLIWVAPDINDPILNRITEAGLPVVALLTRHVPPEAGYVNADNRFGIQLIVRHLIELGHTRIAYAGPAHSSNYLDRRDAYIRALAAAGLPCDPMLDSSPKENNWTGQSYQRMIGGWLELQQPPTAVVAADDAIAEAVIHELTGRGIRVPKEMSVTGFDDITSAGSLLGGLTTVRQHFGMMGQVAAECLIALIEGGSVNNCHITLPVEMIARRTSCQPRQTPK